MFQLLTYVIGDIGCNGKPEALIFNIGDQVDQPKIL